MIKELLVHTKLGQIGMSVRDALHLHKAAIVDLENVGMIANDMLARTLLERMCEDGRIFVDVGAHIGSVIGGAMAHSKPSRLIAIEAVPEKAEALRRRFAGAEIIEAAVGDHEADVDFTIDLARPGYSSLNPDVRSQTSAWRVIRVKVTTPDAILPHQDVDIIKLDIEGAELGALRGAEALVAASRPVIMFESGPLEMAGFPATELWQWFEDHDYDVVLPMRVAHTAAGMSLEMFLDAHRYPRATTNYFGIPRERREQVRQRARSLLGLH